MSLEHASPVEGIVKGYTGDSFMIQASLATLLSLALYNALELIILACTTFHKHRSLYFWSMLITATLGILPQGIGLMIKYFDLAAILIPVTLSTVGWCIMVTGHSFVLYSRLHLVLYNRLVLRFVFYMILADAVILQIPQIILSYGAIYIKGSFPHVFNIWEKVQITGFFIQEVIISSIFIVQAARLLRLDATVPIRCQQKNFIIYQLLFINMLIILLDITQLTLEYNNFFMFQTAVKTFLYSVKLKLEMAVLSKLVLFVHSRNNDGLQL
ncbi:hypothetical protein BJX99DRAFT_268960 [Aspergillus californicus]